MLIVALVLAVISLAALVTAVVTSNELIAWVCIGFSALGVLLLIADAVRDRNRRPVRGAPEAVPAAETTEVLAPVGPHGDEGVSAEEAYGEEAFGEEAYGEETFDEETFDEEAFDEETVEDYPEEVVYDDPDHDLPDDDEPSYPMAAEEAALRIVSDEELAAQADSDEAEYQVTTAVERDVSGSYTVIYSGEAVAEESSNAAPDEPSDIVTESPTVSYAATDDSIVVIYSSENSEEERGGER